MSCKYGLLYGVPNCHLHKLQRVQNAAARLIFEESKYCHVTPLLKSLHWLPVKYRIIFKVLLITFKAIHGLAPVYISELISIRDVSLSRYCLGLTNSFKLSCIEVSQDSRRPVILRGCPQIMERAS